MLDEFGPYRFCRTHPGSGWGFGLSWRRALVKRVGMLSRSFPCKQPIDVGMVRHSARVTPLSLLRYAKGIAREFLATLALKGGPFHLRIEHSVKMLLSQRSEHDLIHMGARRITSSYVKGTVDDAECQNRRIARILVVISVLTCSSEKFVIDVIHTS